MTGLGENACALGTLPDRCQFASLSALETEPKESRGDAVGVSAMI